MLESSIANDAMRLAAVPPSGTLQRSEQQTFLPGLSRVVCLLRGPQLLPVPCLQLVPIEPTRTASLAFIMRK